MKNKKLEPIAIVGIGAIMPGALNKDEFWTNIQEGKNCITEIPKSYWDYNLFYSPDHKAEDKTYSKIGGFIPQSFKFNSIKYRIPPQIAKQMDTVQHLAIETTRMALEDAGYDKKAYDHNRTAVIIGNSMGGMKNEMSNTRLNRPFLYEILKNTPTYKHLAPADAQKMIDEMDEGVREHFTPINEDSMPGELANVIPGRVANVFDLHGTNFAVDAACATSLAAIDQAVNGLRMGNFDMAIAGGVDQMMSPSAFIKFCKIGALSETGSYPFDARANGFVMAEGAGMVILKRLSDAVKDGDRIYAVIRAVGASSDGKGKGITAPNPKGQKLAVEKAFEQVDYNPGEVGLLEAHGTGTRVGDATELNALNEIFAPYAKPGTIGLGSVKSQIGHAKAAAGIAALIKTSLALYNKVLPPSINFETPNPIVDWATCPFRVITKTQEWPAGKIRRANVSAFGFGGTNFHVAMEEMNDSLIQPAQPEVCAAGATPTKQEQVNMTSSNSYTLHVPGEKIQGDVLTFSAPTKQELSDILDKAVMAIEYDPAYLPSISYKNHIAKPQRFAVTINVETPEKLKEKIEFFKKISATQDVWEKESLYLRMKGIYPFTPTEIKPKVCFMFPGQGSQYVDMMKDLAAKYKVVQDTFDEADRLLTHIIGQTLTETLWSKPGESKEQIAQREAAIKKTEMTQPAVLTADIAMMRLLSSFGIKPDVVMGHSLGEYAAAVAAGIFDFENGLKAVCTRGKVMSEIKVEDNGKMASIAAPVERVEPELARINGYVAVANKNCPTQTVIAGASKSIDDAIKMFNDMGIQAVQIPVSHAFHSAIVRPAMPQYRAFLDTLTFHAPTMPITTNVTAEFYPSDPEKIKDLMVTQISHSVEWIKQLKTTYDSGVRLFVECGPKRVLSALAANTLSDKKDIKVLASNHPKKGGISEFNDLFANLISSGIHLDWAGTDMYGNHSTFNPAFVNWVTGTATPVEKELGASSCTATCAAAAPALAEAKNCCDKDIVISGIAAGGPGSWDRIFRDGVLDEILSGRNLIEPVSAEIQQKQIDKHVEFVIKSKDGNHRFERLTSPSQAIKLAARGGAFDAEKEFGLPAKWVRSMDRSFQLAIAAGILALKDAGIPLVLYYKPTSTGGYLPDRWGLPADMIDDTGVIFTSAFPVANSMMGDLSKRVAGLLNNKTAKEVRAFCDKFIAQITDPALKAEIEAWYNENFKDKEVEPMAFTSEFILKTIIIAHSHFCQWIRARGPATSMSAACASTAQAIAVAQDWIKLGRAKRVIVISADDITNDNVSEWILTAFLASGAATTEADVTKAALPFDRRRNGMIVGMGAVSLVVEEAGEVAKRGMKPLAKVLATEIRNSGFHVTRLDVGHVAQVMNDLVSEGERKSGVSRADIAKQLVFISHETYTPARGGSASAEAYALKSTFGADVSKVIVSNTKGFTGHSMGAGLEDAIAVHCLNTGLVPPIANFKEADPELEGITLSKGGHYNFKYALRLAAGFGSQLGMTLLEKVWDVNEPRIIDAARHDAWLKEISGQQNPVLEVVQNTLRVKDNYKHGVKPSLVMEGSQAFVDKVKTMHHTAPAQAAAPAVEPAPAVETVAAPAPAAQPAPAEQTPAQVAKPAFVSKPTAEHIGKPADDALTTNPTAPIERHESLAERPEAPGYKGEHCHEKKLRYVTMVADAPLTERENRRLSKDRTVLIFADNSALIKAYQEEFKELGVKTHVFTTLKTRSKNTTIVNWESYEETEKQLKEYAAEDPNIQGIVYLLGATVKKFDKKVSPHNELTKYVMPLFTALRVFEKGLSNRTDADTFFAVNTKIDGNFGYTTKDEFNPIVGALTGGTTCYRKDVYERTGAISKLMDFEPETTPDEMAQMTMDEVLHGDMRLMIGMRQKVRSTILSVPMRLDRSVKHFDLAGKTIIFTGSGRGIGAMLAQKIAAQYHSKIIILDIIEIQEKTPVWATMNEAELAALKKQMWEEMRADHTQKATPVMLERAFGRVKDSVTLYNNMQKLRDLGSEVEYYHCDVMNSSMMKEVCTKIKAKNSRVDGLIHFAGLERSKLIYDKDPMEYYRIFDVKATSFASFLANNVVKDKGFFAFASSIAGKYGNLGQSDYASANDYLAKSALSLSNQGYRAISIAMSAYKNVGMGVRAGVETFLRSNGVDFVDPEDGMQIFLDEIVYGRVPEIVLTGSLGRLDWDHQLLFEMDEIGADQKFGSDSSNNGSDDGSQNGGGQTPAAEPAAAKDATHFLGNVQKMEAGHELRGEKEFNLKADPYLADHAIEGTPYVPGVMGIETFMETANALMGKAPQGLEDVHFFLPIKLLRNRPQAVRIIGTSDGTQATMEIESDFINSKGVKMGNTRRHFTAKTLNAFTSTWDEVKNEIHLDVNAAPVVTKEEIYKKYFHGPSFQVLGGILRVNEKESLAVYHTTPKPQWPEAKTLLANPMLIEAAFQCCGFQDMSVANKMTLPDGIKEVAVFKREVPPQTLYLYGVNKGLTADGKTLHDAYVFDDKGNVWVEIHGYQAIGQ